LLVTELTLDEKLSLIHGVPGPYVGNVPALTRLGLPALALSDGPAGVGNDMKDVTVFPAPLTVAASWDVMLMETYAAALAEEQRAKGTNVVLAPMMNIARIPQAGRNFEGYGEDPVLSGAMAAAAVRGIQSQGLVATAKHALDNEQETWREQVSVDVDERTQREIYLAPFAAAVEAGVGAIMCSYNKVGGTYACENDRLLNVMLKGELGFSGWIMSDWGATHSTGSALAGLDMEMPDDRFLGAPFANETQGATALGRLDDMVTRIARPLFRSGVWDRAPSGSRDANVRSVRHTELALSAAASGTVLLKNVGALLPLDPMKVHSLVVLGDGGRASPIVAGDGSAHVQIAQVVSPLQGLQERGGAAVKVSDGGNDASLAASADVAVVCVGLTSSEGGDRPSLALPLEQDALVRAAYAVNPHTIVVAHVPGTVLMPWADDVPAIVVAWLPGEESGHALAAVLFGDVSPSGKLPVTFARRASDFAARTPQQYPGVDLVQHYSEGLRVGYRSFDSEDLTPLFPFGHGLSYTSFAYSALVVSPVSALQSAKLTSWRAPVGGDAGGASLADAQVVTVTWTLSNVGARSGAEVGQLYLGFPSTTGEPPRRLAGFRKVVLSPGASARPQISLSKRDLAIWDATLGTWIVPEGTFQVMVGSSSRDLRLMGTFEVSLPHGGPPG